MSTKEKSDVMEKDKKKTGEATKANGKNEGKLAEKESSGNDDKASVDDPKKDESSDKVVEKEEKETDSDKKKDDSQKDTEDDSKKKDENIKDADGNVEMEEANEEDEDDDNDENKEEEDEDETMNDENDPKQQNTATSTTIKHTSTVTTRKRGRAAAASGSSSSTTPDAVTAAALSSASQYASSANWHGLSTLLTTALAPTPAALKQLQQHQLDASSVDLDGLLGTFIIPSVELVQAAAVKACGEQPPWVHWSKTDMAPQLKVVDATSRLQLQGAMRGYRMARASHGVSIYTAKSTTETTTNATTTATTTTTIATTTATSATPSTPAAAALLSSASTAVGGNASIASSSNNSNNHQTMCCYYYECIILPGPTATEILKSLPPNARLGPGLREQLNKAVEWEEQQQQQQNSNAKKPRLEKSSPKSNKKNNDDSKSKKNTPDTSTSSSSPSSSSVPPRVGGHVRLGWSMRTGDLQAPVGYDKWSYGIRDQGGSIIHCSQRQDHWGGQDFSKAGTVIGCAIALDSASIASASTASGGGASSSSNPNNTGGAAAAAAAAAAASDAVAAACQNNHIRFFKNGDCMGRYVIEKGKRTGGEAFTNIELGTYYPAVSCYMGGAVKVNFGPYWICPPKKSKLPSYMKNKLLPVSSVCPPPLSPEQAVANCAAAAKVFRKADHQQAFKEAVRAEAEIQFKAYKEFFKNHIKEIREARKERGLSTHDLPDDDDAKS